MLASVLGSPERFLAALFDDLARAGVDVAGYACDHLCYRVETLERYHALRARLGACGRLLTENDVQGRPIATFALHEPVGHGDHAIGLVELPAPKPGRVRAEGYEHVEFVVGAHLAEFPARYPGCDFDRSGLAKAHNPELVLALPSGSVKFHPTSLLEVIQTERLAELDVSARTASEILDDLARSGRLPDAGAVREVFAMLADYDPEPAGTLPIGVETAASDLDVLCGYTDPEVFAQALRANFGGRAGFALERGASRGVPFVAATFRVDGLAVEVFGQRVPPRRQDAFRHMVAESRLLALCGQWAHDAIRARKNAGQKTEPAFGDFFGLSGDPYATLLDLEAAPIDRLRAIATARLRTP